MRSKNLVFWLFSLSLMTWLILPVLLDEGMFMDGLIYAGISRNLAHGLGSLWAPHFSNMPVPVFYDHPPLVFWIQSVFFRLMGDSRLTEDIYCIFTAIISGLMLLLLWRQSNKDPEMPSQGWLPLLLWWICAATYLAYTSNVLECTLSIFTMSSIFFILKANKPSFSISLPSYLLAAFMVFLAGLAKGPLAFFPLGTVFLYWLVFRSFSFGQMLIRSLILISFTALLYVILIYLWDDARTGLQEYLRIQVLKSLKGEREASGHFNVLRDLLNDLLPLFSLLALSLMLRFKKPRIAIPIHLRKQALFYFLVALSASLPIMVSPKQMGFYVTPSMPYYALAAAFLLLPDTKKLVHYLEPKIASRRVLSLLFSLSLMACLVFSAFRFGTVGRDADMIYDVRQVGEQVGWNADVSTPFVFINECGLAAYFGRYYNITLDYKNPSRPYYLTYPGDTAPANYEAVQLDLRKYVLYHRKN